jgi:predicted secreted protein
MDIISGVIVFLLVWWTILFCVLPWGNHPDENPDVAHVKSAPANPRLRRKFLITTLITCVLWLIIYGLIEANVISFTEVAQEMAQEEITQ